MRRSFPRDIVGNHTRKRANHYATEAKNDARQLLIDFALLCAVKIIAVLTLPAREGFCGKAFKKAFPGCWVTGIDRSNDIVRFSNLPGTRVDEYFQGDVNSLAKKDHPILGHRARRQSFIDYVPHIEHEQTPIDFLYGLIFLDYTGLLSQKAVRLAKQIVENYGTPDAIVGVTFSLDVEMKDAERDRLVNDLINYGSRAAPPHYYQNKNSNMLLVIFQR